MDKEIKIGLLGCGQVGQGLVKLLKQQSDFIKKRTGINLKIDRVLVRDINKPRGLPRHLLTNNPDEVIFNLETEIIVELLGGIEPAHKLILKALKAGKHIITANKAVLAIHGEEIIQCARKYKRQVYYEASVCAGLPIIRSIREGLSANRISSIQGILNGTTNYILTKMFESNEQSFPEALKQAQQNGLAEPDPTLDVSGIDSAHKLSILGSLAFGIPSPFPNIYTEGITKITNEDIKSAEEFGFVIKLLAIAKKLPHGQIELRVHPTMIPKTHPLASVRNEFNAVLIYGDAVGKMMFYGKGAGPIPTASALLSDIIELSSKIITHQSKIENIYWEKGKIVPIENIETEYYLRFPIIDKPGVIGKITTILGNNNVSILGAHAVLVPGNKVKGHQPGSIYVITEKSSEKSVRQALTQINKLPVMRDNAVTIRIEKEH
ncbi:MAG: homoserine dehydrogenase [Planctomycetota bacterium]